MQAEDQYLTSPPKDGVYVKGLYLEAAAWDRKAGILIEPEPMQLVCPMPTILFKPIENKKKYQKCKNLKLFFLFYSINVMI